MEEFDAKTRELQTSLTTTQHELEEVKGLYVTVCEAKDRMEEEQARCMQETLQQEMARVRGGGGDRGEFWGHDTMQGCYNIVNILWILSRDTP